MIDVRLRAVRVEDLDAFFDHQSDPEANRMAAFTPRDRDAFLAHWTTILADETGIARTVLVDGGVAGNVVSWTNGDEREVGYWIGREFWGRGVATTALRSFLLDHEVTRPLHAYVAAHNVGSARVLERCGFTLSAEVEREPGPEGERVRELVYVLGRDAAPGGGPG